MNEQPMPLQQRSALEVVRSFVGDLAAPKLSRIQLGDITHIYSPTPPSIAQMIYAALFFTVEDQIALLTRTAQSTRTTEGAPMEFNFKSFVVRLIVQWVLKIGGTYLGTIGISTGSIEEVVGGVVLVVIGLVSQALQSVKLLHTDPPKS